MAIVLLPACAPAGGESNKEPVPADQLSPQARQTMARQKQEALRLRTVGKAEKENTLSPYRYVTSTERYTIFGSLVKASSLSRAIHSQGVTLLCPKDEAFEADSNWKTLLREENREALDEWVSRHAIPIVMRYGDFKMKEEHLDLNGNPITVETRGGITANGARVRSGDVPTENGTIIGLDDLLMAPTDAL
jgi:uncharacterized surface protein with fasciclin (FAS1) repeats